MPRCVCAVFDYSEDYLTRFSNYIKKCNSLPFALFSFTEKESLEKFLKGQRVNLLLVTDSSAKKNPAGFAEELASLSGEKTAAAILGDKSNAPPKTRFVNRYQSAEGIVSEIIGILEEMEMLGPANPSASGDADITGIYSFGHLDKAVSFALNLARSGSGQNKALYINLMRFSGLESVLEEPPGANLSDVIYYYVSNSEKIRGAYLNARGRSGAADIITASPDLEELELISEENWKGFIERLADIAGAKKIILDIGEAFRNIAKGFGLCNSIYLVCDPESDRERILRLKEYLINCEREDLAERLIEADIRKAGAWNC